MLGTIHAKHYQDGELIFEDLTLCAKKPTLSALQKWAKWAMALDNRVVVISPVNPGQPKLLQSDAAIRNMDDVAMITQWLGGVTDDTGPVHYSLGNLTDQTEYGLEVYGQDIMY